MALARNAFKIRAADAPIIETSQFLHLYCPVFLGILDRDDLFIPKLVIIRGSPGSGKSSLLRLFETDTLLALHENKNQSDNQQLVERLLELGILTNSGPKVIGIYLQCDSSLRDIANIGLEDETGALKLLNTLIDIRIVRSFIQSIDRMRLKGLLPVRDDFRFQALPMTESPPDIFGESMSIEALREKCLSIEKGFSVLLNSFPGEPRPESTQPHARIYSVSYLAWQVQSNPILKDIVPIVMLDDFHELYLSQRDHIRDEFMRRASIPRWIAVRNHIFGLEELVSLHGSTEGRDYRDISIDEKFRAAPTAFRRFASNVSERRLLQTSALQRFKVDDFKSFLDRREGEVTSERALRTLKKMLDEIKRNNKTIPDNKLQRTVESIENGNTVKFSELMSLQRALIVSARPERHQGTLFAGVTSSSSDEVNDSKLDEAAELFLTAKLGLPYYFGFDALSDISSLNVEQFLSVASMLADKMIFRVELGNDPKINAKDQQDLFKKKATEYYNDIERIYNRGVLLQKLILNLGHWAQLQSYLPNAPIAPGVTGFGMSKEELSGIVSSSERSGKLPQDYRVLRQVLTSAVSGNVLLVRQIRQGQQSGEEKTVFYLNRLLCVRFRLPLNYGGWKRITAEMLIRMLKSNLPNKELGLFSSVSDQPDTDKSWMIDQNG